MAGRSMTAPDLRAKAQEWLKGKPYFAGADASLTALLDSVAEEARLEALEAAAKVAEVYGPNRPMTPFYARSGSEPRTMLKGRWEGEQASSANIASAIRALAAPREGKP